jgi:hypothetical protein
MPAFSFNSEFLGHLDGLECVGYDASQPFEVKGMIHPRYPMAFPESVMPEVIREDVCDAVLDALAMRNMGADVLAPEEDWGILGMSEPVTLPPHELEF